jgi:hypothetical protein
MAPPTKAAPAKGAADTAPPAGPATRTGNGGTPVPVNKAGRPPRFVAEPTLATNLCALLSNGASRNVACRALGLEPAMLSRWMGRAGKKYRALRQQVEKAEAAYVMRHVQRINKAAEKSWQASAWVLARKLPEEFGARDRVTVAGDPKAPLSVDVKDVSHMTLEELDAYEARLLEVAAAHGAYAGAGVAASAHRDPKGAPP